eukprot:4326930-Pyramimonas_sp.AAC.1
MPIRGVDRTSSPNRNCGACYARVLNLLVLASDVCSRALELFREFDKNSSGYLDRRELTSLVMRIFPEIKRRELRYFRAMLDVEGDG